MPRHLLGLACAISAVVLFRISMRQQRVAERVSTEDLPAPSTLEPDSGPKPLAHRRDVEP
jgi:hypothetical protein